MGALLAQSKDKATLGYLSGVLEEMHSCIANKQQMKEAIGKYLTQSDRQYLILFAESDIKPTAESMAEFWGGGRDCKHKNVSPGDQRFLNKLPDLIEQRAVEQQQAEQEKKNQDGSGSDTGSDSPDYTTGPSNGSGSSGSDSGSSGSGSDTSEPAPEPDNGGNGGSQPIQTDWTKYALIGGGVVGSLVLISALSG